MKKPILYILFLLIFSINVNAQLSLSYQDYQRLKQTSYNQYTNYKPYYYNDQYNYTNNRNNSRNDRVFEIGIIVMGVGMVTILSSLYYDNNYGSYYYERKMNYPLFYTGLALTGTGIVISLSGSKIKRVETIDNNVYYE